MRIIRDSAAQASAVALMLACVALVIILAMISSAYVPVWMKEKESEHMRKVEESFGNLKSLIDTQVSKNNTTECSLSLTLGCEGVFLFTPGNLGTVSIAPFEGKLNIVNSTSALNFTATGNIKFNCQNRYYVKQDFIYEFGSVVISQLEGKTIIQNPIFSVKNESSCIKMNFTLISIYGANSTATGYGEQAIRTKLKAQVKESYSWDYENVTINITTNYPHAWYKYFAGILENSGIQEAPGGVNLTIPNFQRIRERLVQLQNEINANISKNIVASGASEIVESIDEIIDKVDEAIEAVQENDTEDVVESTQEAIQETHETIDEVYEALEENETNPNYANYLVEELKKIIAMLQGESEPFLGAGYRIFLYKNGVGVEIYGMNKLNISYAVIEVKIL
ncbi:MAG: hypothetical protein QMD21_04605 [Candidatus Thermoplasmatota archaeon]|nr:hypothetical protein [Candidatus Thermoplasmatota archaeon]